MWLIDWLQTKWTELNYWFSSNFWTWVALLNAIPGYLNNLANNIASSYNNAVNQIQSRINNFYNGTIAPIVDYLRGLVLDAKNWATNAWNDLQNFKATIPSQIAFIEAFIKSWVISTYNDIINSLRNSWDNFKNVTLPDILNKVADLFKHKNWLDVIAPKLNLEWLNDLITSWGTVKATAITLASNPIGFIFGLFWSRGIEFLSFLIAYSLGTMEADLPAIPSWGNTGGGDTTPLPVTPGTLGKPLDSLYISGYVFATGHYGVDYGLNMGQKVYAAHEGDIVAAGPSSVGYGNYIDLAGDGYWSRYAHLQSFAVAPGVHVKKGDVIGYGDSTGNSTGPHLHFELKINGTYVNPVLYIS